MEKKAGLKPRVVIRQVMVRRYSGLNAAARLLDVSPTQVKRHVSGHTPSMSLARRMAERGVVVEA